MTTDAAQLGAIDLGLARILHAALGRLLELGPMDTDPGKLLFTPEEAAERLGLKSTNWLYKHSADRSIPRTPVAGLLRFSRGDLDRIVEMHGEGRHPDDAGRRPRTAQKTRQH